MNLVTADGATLRTPHSALVLPSLPPGLLREFKVQTKSANLFVFAELLARLGVLQARHWRGDTTASCQRALADHLAATPCPLANLQLHVLEPDEAYSQFGQLRDCRHKDIEVGKTKLNGGRHTGEAAAGVLMLIIGGDSLEIFTIGPALRRLEKLHPRLGQAVLALLDAGLDKSCRGLTPTSGYGWAQGTYWMGELDETMHVEESLAEMEAYAKSEKKPFDRKAALAELDMFTRAQYDDAIPPAFGSEHDFSKLVPDKIVLAARRRLQRAAVRPGGRTKSVSSAGGTRGSTLRWAQQVIAAAQALSAQVRPLKHNPTHRSEYLAWEICPFALRWSDDDPLLRIYDDTVNNYAECGEVQMDTNAVWGWWDEASLAHALAALHTYLDVVRHCEALIKLLAK